mgnify:CR=1 FL=1
MCIRDSHYTTFNRDGGFMDYISNLVQRKFKISKKDSWNPADIWVIKNEALVIDKIENAVRGNHPTITELNEVMKRLWHDKELKGISLKAVSGDVAYWEEVNLDDSLFMDKKQPPIFEVSDTKCMLTLVKGKFESTDTIVNVKEGRSTWFFSHTSAKTARKKWISSQLKTRGSIIIDKGAEIALRKGASLLPAGIIEVKGVFSKGDTIKDVSYTHLTLTTKA